MYLTNPLRGSGGAAAELSGGLLITPLFETGAPDGYDQPSPPAHERGHDGPQSVAGRYFVIVGGGPTGVELAGAIAELARKALACDFRHIDPRQARVILIEAGSRLLATFPEKLSAAAQRPLHVLASMSALAHA